MLRKEIEASETLPGNGGLLWKTEAVHHQFREDKRKNAEVIRAIYAYVMHASLRLKYVCLKHRLERAQESMPLTNGPERRQ